MMLKDSFDVLLRQAKDVEGQIKDAKSSLADVSVVGEAGGGMVSVSMNAAYEIHSVHVDDALLGDKVMLCDLLVAAFNAAILKASNEQSERYQDAVFRVASLENKMNL